MGANFKGPAEWAGTDEVVTEVRIAREAYAARFDFDLRRMVEDLKAKERSHPERISNLVPLVPSKASC